MLHIVGIILGFALLYSRLWFHEFMHAIAAKIMGIDVPRIFLGGERWHFTIGTTWVDVGLNPLSGFIRPDNWRKKSRRRVGYMFLAGTIADLTFVPTFLYLTWITLPLTAFFYVLAIGIAIICSTLESRFHEGHDLYEFVRHTRK